MYHGQRPLRQILRIENQDVVAQHVEMIQQRNQVALALSGRPGFGHKHRLLERTGRPGPVQILLPRLPLKMAHDVEKPTRRRPALGKVIRLGGINDALPEVVVLLGQDPVVDARELAVDAEGLERLDACVRWGLGVEDPAVGVGDEFVALQEGRGRVGEGVGREEEEDVV